LYLRNLNQFVIWDIAYDKTAPFLSNPNFHPKQTFVDITFSANLGRGNWQSCKEAVLEGLNWARAPWDVFIPTPGSRAEKVSVLEPLDPTSVSVMCRSSTDLDGSLSGGTFDLVITDPPFGYNLGYSDMAEFFYVWLRLGIPSKYLNLFSSERTPRAQEVITN